MKYLKYILVFSIPAILGIYFGLINKSDGEMLNGYVENSPQEDTQQDTMVEQTEMRANVTSFEELITIISQTQGVYSLYIKNLNTKEVEKYNADEFYDAASVFKVYVAVSVMKNIEQNNLTLDHYYKITSDDFETGTGILQYEPVGEKYSVSELLELALKKSDNVAQNMLIRAIEKRYIPDSTFTLDNDSSARKIGVFLEKFYNSDFISNESRDYLLDLMKDTDFEDRISTGLSQNVEFSHKIGNWPYTNSWHDCGIATNANKGIIVCLMSKNTNYEAFVDMARYVGAYVDYLLN